MKKFTLLLLAFMAVVSKMQAEALANSWSTWGATCTVTDGTTISTTAQYGGAGCWWGTTNASSYDYIAVVVTDVTGTLKIYAQCGTSEPRTSTTEYSFATAGTIYIDLNETTVRNKKAELVSLGIQQLNETGTAGCTVESITLVTASDLPPRHEDLSLAGVTENETTTLGWAWNSTYNPTTKAVSFDANWCGNGWYFGNKNGNDYTRLIVEFGSPLVDAVNINVTYTAAPSTPQTDEIAAGKTYHELTLNSNKYDIQTIHFSNSTNERATSCVLKRVYLCNAKYVALDDGIASTITAVEHADVELARTFAEGWNTLCLPFVTTGTALGADVYEFISATTSSVTFKKLAADTETTAGTPYLVKFASAASNLTFEDVNITGTTAGTVTKNEVNFIGSYAPVSFATTGNFGVLSNGNIQEGAANASSINGYRAYFTGLSAAGLSRVLIVDDEATGINNTYTLNSDNDEVYTLTGTKVNGQPTKGIFIKNGKKYVVKSLVSR